MTTAAPRPMSPLAWAGAAVVGVIALLAPVIFSDFTYGVLFTKALWMGLVAMSLIFLSSYGGMVSLAQVGIFGISGFTMANLVAAEGGLPTAISPWLALPIALLVAVSVALVFGAIAARSEGIYFLMITLAFGVIVFFFFGQVTQLSGFGGISRMEMPGFLGNPAANPAPLYYVSLGVAAVAFAAAIYVARTPFGLTLQGIRDEPTRMRALGYNVELHRTLAFGAAGLIAACAGILFVWYQRHIGPGSINLGMVITILVVAVIGGLYRIQGAWVGALAFVMLDNFTRRWTPNIGDVLGPDRFNTLLGLIFLAIVLLSPGGLVGAWEQAGDRIRATFRRSSGSGQEPDASGVDGTATDGDDPVGRESEAAADRPGPAVR